MAKIIHRYPKEMTLGKLQGSARFNQLAENQSQMLPVILKRSAKHDDVIQVKYYPFPPHFREYFVHGSLKRSWCVDQAKRHPDESVHPDMA
jgi:hypothetical protein